MFQPIEIPTWLMVVICALAALAVLDRLLVPSARWFIRRRVNRVLEEVGQHLDLKIEGFKLTKREVLIDRLMFDPEVIVAAETHAEVSGMPRQVAMERVERYAREIVPAFNAYFYFRIGYWIARRIAQLLYRVRFGMTDENAIASIEAKSTVVFLMNHRSNMDYILVAYLAASRTTLSYAVGEWARIWPLQGLIRAMGAYFVRRKSRNALYRKVLARYIHMATAGGVTQAMYPEGGLTRDGRIGKPKMGLLDYMLRSFDPDGERDLVFVPVGINYDRVLEDRTQLLALEGDTAVPTLGRTIMRTVTFISRNLGQMLLGRWFRFGYACVNFGRPVSMRLYCRERNVSPAHMERDQRVRIVTEIAEDLMDRLARIIPVVPVSLVATVLRDRVEPMTALEIKAQAQSLMEELETGGAHVHIPRANREYAIDVGLRILAMRHIVSEHDGLYRPEEAERAALSYYANSIVHLRTSTSDT